MYMNTTHIAVHNAQAYVTMMSIGWWSEWVNIVFLFPVWCHTAVRCVLRCTNLCVLSMQSNQTPQSDVAQLVFVSRLTQMVGYLAG